MQNAAGTLSMREQTEGASIDRVDLRDIKATPMSARSAGALIALQVAWLSFALAANSFAGEREWRIDNADAAVVPLNSACEAPPSVLDPVVLPPLDSIDARTNLAVFLQEGVPVELRLAALRRAWIADPAIRDFKGLQENHWDFDNLNSVPGFGELGPEVDIAKMLAQVVGDAPPSTERPKQPVRPSFLAAALHYLIGGGHR